MPILVKPAARSPCTIFILFAEVLQRISTALPEQCAEFPVRPFDKSHALERYAQFSTNGIPARSLASSNRERNAPSISLSEQDGTHFLNSISEKYLLIVYGFFESTYLYYLCYCSKLTDLFYKLIVLSLPVPTLTIFNLLDV